MCGCAHLNQMMGFIYWGGATLNIPKGLKIKALQLINLLIHNFFFRQEEFEIISCIIIYGKKSLISPLTT